MLLSHIALLWHFESPVVRPLPTLWCRVAELSDRRLDKLQPNMS